MAAQRVDIGFTGGQVLSVRIDEGALKDLRGALDRGSGWHDLASEDGEVALDLAKVAYLRLDSGEHRVGFATES
jgi:hypothetical protein